MKVYLAYPLTSEAEKAVFAKTGKRPEVIGTGLYSFPYTALTEEEFMALTEDDRLLISQLGVFLRSGEFAACLPQRVRATGSQYDGPGTVKEHIQRDHPLTVGEWLAEAAALTANNERVTAQVEGERREWLQAKIDAATPEVAVGRSSGLFGLLYDEAKRLRLNLAAYEAAVVEAEGLKAAEAATRAAAKAASEEAEAAAREAAEQAKAAWIAAHGSSHLRRAFSRGHDCQRMYVLERAAEEMPGYVVDFEDNAQWSTRACPSSAALDEAERVERLDLRPADEIEVQIVWLTAPAQAERDEEEYAEEFEKGEAVVVRGYLSKYDLVRQM